MTRAKLATYLAMDRRLGLAAGTAIPDRMTGSALLADISGFTPLTEALVEQLGPRRGAEELTRILNTVYTALVSPIHSSGGSVVCFIGDALIACFPEDDGVRGVACGLAMQRVMASFEDLTLPGGARAALAMKTAVTAGPMRRFLVGDPSIRRIDVLAGRTVDRLSDAEHAARPGDVIASPEVAGELHGQVVVDAWRGTHAAVAGLRQEIAVGDPAATAPDIDPEFLRPFVLPPVYDRVLAGHGEFLSELRPVTAVFLRFEGIDYDKDDRAGEKLDAYTAWVQSEVARYGGDVLLLTTADKGSHLYAVFGALEAHEDDASRAIATAERLLHAPDSLSFIRNIQIGVSYGRARVGAYGGETRRTYGALGNVVNHAARLMGVAPPGEIRCSQSVVNRSQGSWSFDELEAVELKGITGPQPVYRPAGRWSGTAAPRTGIIGREAERADLIAALREAASGSRRLRVLEGEAGIGKSRLVDDLLDAAAKQAFTCLVGTGDSIEQHTAYRVWRDLLTSFFGVEEILDPETRRQQIRTRIRTLDPGGEDRLPLLNDILALGFPETPLTAGYTPEVRHESLAAWISGLLATHAGSHPLVLVFDDAHWLDSLSWDLTLSVAQSLAHSPALLVLTHRPFGESEPPGLSALCGLAHSRRVQLGALPGEATVSLAAAHLGLEPDAMPKEISALVFERAGGNPFYARELVRALLDTGQLAIEGSACHITVTAEKLRESLPETLEGVVLSRLDRLSNDEQLTMKAASVIGRSFLFRTLAKVHPGPISGGELRTHLANTTHRLFTVLEAEDPELLYAFQHAVTQQATYDTLLFEQRRDLHHRVATWYEAAYAETLPPHYPLLVFHWNRAGQEEHECRYAILAGEQAAHQYANSEADLYFTRALALIERIGDGNDHTRRYGILQQRVRVYALLGEVEAERADLEALLEIAEASGGPSREGSVLGLWADHHNRCGRFTEAQTCGEASLAAMRAAGDPKGEAEALTRLAKTFEEQGEFERAREQAQSALRIFRKTGNLDGEAATLKSLGVIRARLGELPQSMEAFEAARIGYRQIGDRKGEADILGNLGALSYYLGNYEATIRYTEQAQPMFEAMGNRSGSVRCLSNLGNSYNALGAFERGLDYHQRSAALYQQIEDANGYADSLTNMGNACHALGVGGYPELTCGLHPENAHLRDALEHHRKALDIAAQIGSKPGEVISHFNLGSVHLCLGRTKDAETHLQRAMRLGQDLGMEDLALRSLAALARAALQRSDPDSALEQSAAAIDRLGEQALPYADEIHFTRYRVLAFLGREEEAAEHLRRATDAIFAQSEAIQDPDLRASYRAMHHEVLSARSQAEAASPQEDAA